MSENEFDMVHSEVFYGNCRVAKKNERTKADDAAFTAIMKLLAAETRRMDNTDGVIQFAVNFLQVTHININAAVRTRVKVAALKHGYVVTFEMDTVAHGGVGVRAMPTFE